MTWYYVWDLDKRFTAPGNSSCLKLTLVRMLVCSISVQSSIRLSWYGGSTRLLCYKCQYLWLMSYLLCGMQALCSNCSLRPSWEVLMTLSNFFFSLDVTKLLSSHRRYCTTVFTGQVPLIMTTQLTSMHKILNRQTLSHYKAFASGSLLFALNKYRTCWSGTNQHVQLFQAMNWSSHHVPVMRWNHLETAWMLRHSVCFDQLLKVFIRPIHFLQLTLVSNGQGPAAESKSVGTD